MKKNNWEKIRLPYYGQLVRNVPRKDCLECKHYGCTDAREITCQGFEKSGKLTIAIRKILKKVF